MKAVLLNTMRNLRNVILQVVNLQIEMTDCVKYLRVIFEQNCHMMAVKAYVVTSTLCRPMPNKGDSQSGIGREFGSVVHSVLLFAADSKNPLHNRATYLKRKTSGVIDI